jgi:hypothetical protein
MPHIFVSHATVDDKVASQIHHLLQAAGIDSWVDHEAGLKAGDYWDDKIQAALNDCDAGLLLLSPLSAKSPECNAEYRRILSLGKRLYVALIQPTPKADFPWRLTTIQYVDMARDFDGGLKELTAAITGMRDLDPASPVTAQANPVSGSFPRWQLDVPLIGRETELAEVTKSLADGSRSTVILGLGGVGKTRLALEMMQRGGFKDGVVWQTIAPDTTLAHLTLLIRDHLGLPSTAESDQIWAALAKHAVLIVLDNAEDCAEQSAYADRINRLDLAGGTRVLLTSRSQWPDLRGATRISLRSPDLHAAIDIVRAIAAYEKPDHSLDGYETQIAEAAQRHPRLIWYAVLWANDNTPAEVVDMLATLKGNDAEAALDDLVRKTLRRMAEQPGGSQAEAALRKLVVCRGGFTRAAAHALAGETESLKLLKRWGLVSEDQQRYIIDPLVIAAVDEAESAHQAHYAYYKALAWQHDDQQDYLGLDPESVNLETAFEWAMRAGDDVDALNLANAVGQYFYNRGRFSQILDWHKRVAEKLAAHSDKTLWANAQNSLGSDYQNLPTGSRSDNLRRAVTAYQAALEYYTPKTAPLDYARIQNNLGAAYRDLAGIEDREANLRLAIAAFQAALVYRTPQAAPLAYAMTQNNLGNAYSDLAGIEDWEANLRLAIAAYQAALEHYTPKTAPLHYATTQNNLGVAYRDLAGIEDWEANLRLAIAAYQSALVYRTPRAAPLDYAMTQGNLGNVYEELGTLPAAIACWREAEIYYRQMGDMRNADLMLQWIAVAEGESGGEARE